MQSFLCSLPIGKKLNDKYTASASGLPKYEKMLLRESLPRQVDKSRVSEKEIEIWKSQGGGKDRCLFFFLYIPQS